MKFCKGRSPRARSRTPISSPASTASVNSKPPANGENYCFAKIPSSKTISPIVAANANPAQGYDAGSHPDFNHVYKELLEFTEEGKDKKTPISFPIDVVREFVIAKASSKPTLSERKIFVVSEGEKLQDAAQNCLLKTLEEPPAYCFIILLCSRLDKLLPTIKSRCQIIRFCTNRRKHNHRKTQGNGYKAGTRPVFREIVRRQYRTGPAMGKTGTVRRRTLPDEKGFGSFACNLQIRRRTGT